MSWLKGITAVTYAVRQETLRQWGWFWTEGLGGQIISIEDVTQPGTAPQGTTRWRIDMGEFETVLLAGHDQGGPSSVKDFTDRFGDHAAYSLDYAVERLTDLRDHTAREPAAHILGSPLGTDQGFNFVQRERARRRSTRPGQWSPLLKRIDHVTYAVTPSTIDQCARFWIEGMGGVMVLKNDDVRPDDANDSMMLWGIVLNQGVPDEEFGIALVAGINRRRVSQVTRFVEHKGPNIVQHVAYDVGDMAAFRRHFEGEFGANLLSETLVVPDGFGGHVRQVFGRGYEAGNAAEVCFPEFLERLKESGKGFTNAAGEGLYERVQRASEAGDDTPIVDFSRMPADWEPPRISRKTA